MQCFISTIPFRSGMGLVTGTGNVPARDHERIALKNADGIGN